MPKILPLTVITELTSLFSVTIQIPAIFLNYKYAREIGTTWIQCGVEEKETNALQRKGWCHGFWLAIQPRCHQHPLTLQHDFHCPMLPLHTIIWPRIHGIEISLDSEENMVSLGNTNEWLSFFPWGFSWSPFSDSLRCCLNKHWNETLSFLGQTLGFSLWFVPSVMSKGHHHHECYHQNLLKSGVTDLKIRGKI